MGINRTIRSLQVSDKDVLMCAKLAQKPVTYFAQPSNYKGRVVIKPWGYEFLFFETGAIAAWFLYIKKGHSTSMHCHPRKTTSLIVLHGRALVNTFANRHVLTRGDCVILDSKVFHSTNACYDEDICLFEIESPPQKDDLLRFDDNYGRNNFNYESCAEMEIEHLARYHYFQLEPRPGHEPLLAFPQVELSLVTAPPIESEWNPEALYCSCDARVHDQAGGITLAPGIIALGADLQGAHALNITHNSRLLEIKLL